MPPSDPQSRRAYQNKFYASPEQRARRAKANRDWRARNEMGATNRSRGIKRQRLWMRDHGQCVYCQTKVTVDNYQIEHRLPRSRGGDSSWANIAVACWNCNRQKSTMTDAEFLAWRAARAVEEAEIGEWDKLAKESTG